MTDTMRKTLRDGATGLVSLLVIGALLVMVGSGCAAQTAQHGHKASAFKPARNWKPGKRCKTLGKALTTHVAVLVEKNCLKNGVTTVNMVVLNKEKRNGRPVAAEHAVQAITAILGFKPVLKILFYGKAKGKPFFMTAVTGISRGGAVAGR